MRNSAHEVDMLKVVGVVEVKERSVHDGRGQVDAPTAIGDDVDPKRAEAAIGLKGGAVVAEKGCRLPVCRISSPRSNQTFTGRPVKVAPRTAKQA